MFYRKYGFSELSRRRCRRPLRSRSGQAAIGEDMSYGFGFGDQDLDWIGSKGYVLLK